MPWHYLFSDWTPILSFIAGAFLLVGSAVGIVSSADKAWQADQQQDRVQAETDRRRAVSKVVLEQAMRFEDLALHYPQGAGLAAGQFVNHANALLAEAHTTLQSQITPAELADVLTPTADPMAVIGITPEVSDAVLGLRSVARSLRALALKYDTA